MDIFETNSSFANPLNNPLNTTATPLSSVPVVINDPDVEVHTDPASGKRYTINRKSGDSSWLEDDENPNLAML
jgi:hypothetical protein